MNDCAGTTSYGDHGLSDGTRMSSLPPCVAGTDQRTVWLTMYGKGWRDSESTMMIGLISAAAVFAEIT